MRELSIHLVTPAPTLRQGWKNLSQEEEVRAGRFVFAKDADRWRCYRAALRSILATTLGVPPAELPIINGPNGKPALAPPFDSLHFNLSHSDELAAVIVSEEGPVGIDLEPWSRAVSLLECSEIFCHPDEIQSLPDEPQARARRLLEIWTSKEAILKALGTGLSFPPQVVRIDGARAVADRDLEGIQGLWIQAPEHPSLEDYRLAIATPHETVGLQWKDFSKAG